MNEKPLLFFPRPVPGTKSQRRGGSSTLGLPTAEQQRERLEVRFQQIVDSFLSAQETIDGAEPEMVVVFETAGDEVAELARAAREIDGLEWLAELDSDGFEAAHGFQDTERPEKPVPRRLNAVMSNHSALERLVQLWSPCPTNQRR